MAAMFFADETDLALGRRLADAWGDVVYPGHEALPDVPRGTLDDHWLPIIGRRRLVVITRDQHIRRRPAEKLLWVAHGVRGFVLTGKKSQSTADSLGLLEQHRDRIDEIVAAAPDGPWMQAVTERGLRSINLV